MARDAFSGLHPVVNFIYFVLVLGFTMIFMHPVLLCISLAAALIYSVYLGGSKSLKFSFKYMLPLLILTAALNPLFNHEGATIIWYFSNGNPLTLESIAFGAAAAVMLITVILWFSCYNAVMTSDKFIYLFGRVIPALSLIFSMVLRFVPRLKAQFKTVSNAQKCIGRDVKSGKLTKRVKNAVTILSIMVTWTLENSIETADSMKSRGYGLGGRTAFSIYFFDRRDFSALIVALILGVYIGAGYLTGGVRWGYFPEMTMTVGGIYTISIFICYLALCLMPVIMNLLEDRKWRVMRSGI
jgi:energy-coupling factor transport system permease protein